MSRSRFVMNVTAALITTVNVHQWEKGYTYCGLITQCNIGNKWKDSTDRCYNNNAPHTYYVEQNMLDTQTHKEFILYDSVYAKF